MAATKKYLSRNIPPGALPRAKLGKVRYPAGDQFPLRKGHHQMTVVLELQRGQILHAQEGRDAKALIPFLAKLADTHDGQWQGFWAYYDHPIASGPLEGLNNIIKVLKRQAYGFRDNDTSSSGSTSYTRLSRRLPDDPQFGHLPSPGQ
jgi:hypothetical protein